MKPLPYHYYVPWPPSVNSMWRSWQGRTILSKKGREWYKDAEERLRLQHPALPLDHPVRVTLKLMPPTKRKYDIDNRAKPCLDALVKAGILKDDNHMHIPELLIIHEPDDKIDGVMIDLEKVV